MNFALVLLGVALLTFAMVTQSSVVLLLIGCGLVGLSEMIGEFTIKSEPNNRNSLMEWAEEAVRGLPNSDTVARKLVDYVDSQEIDKPWDASTVEAVEAIIEDAAKPELNPFMAPEAKAKKIMNPREEQFARLYEAHRRKMSARRGAYKTADVRHRYARHNLAENNRAEIITLPTGPDPRRETLELRELRRRQRLSEPETEVREIRAALEKLANADQIGYDPKNDLGGI